IRRRSAAAEIFGPEYSTRGIQFGDKGISAADPGQGSAAKCQCYTVKIPGKVGVPHSVRRCCLRINVCSGKPAEVCRPTVRRNGIRTNNCKALRHLCSSDIAGVTSLVGGDGAGAHGDAGDGGAVGAACGANRWGLGAENYRISRAATGGADRAGPADDDGRRGAEGDVLGHTGTGGEGSVIAVDGPAGVGGGYPEVIDGAAGEAADGGADRGVPGAGSNRTAGGAAAVAAGEAVAEVYSRIVAVVVHRTVESGGCGRD